MFENLVNYHIEIIMTFIVLFTVHDVWVKLFKRNLKTDHIDLTQRYVKLQEMKRREVQNRR